MAAWRSVGRRSARRTAIRILATVLVAATAAAGLAATAGAQDRYTDVSSTHHAAHKANIEALESQGVFDGTECGARKFCPTRAVKRWEAAVWIVRVIDGEDPFPVAKSRFADVDNGEWWMPYVERLADLGITVGCRQSPLRYCPHSSVTRAQMASFLVRAFRLQRAPSANFADTRGNVHEENIDALFAVGITIGCKERPARFCPGRATTRAHMAHVLEPRADQFRPNDHRRRRNNGRHNRRHNGRNNRRNNRRHNWHDVPGLDHDQPGSPQRRHPDLGHPGAHVRDPH